MKICLGQADEQAATLAELVISIAFLGIMAAGIMGSFSYGFLAVELTRENQRASQILLEKVETLRLYSWSQVNSNGFIPPTFTEVYDPQASGSGQGITYTGTVTLADFPASPTYSTNLKQVVVTLTWTTAGKVSHTRTLATVVARNGEQNYVW